MKIGSFKGLIPSSRLPDKIAPADIGELIANLIGLSARSALFQLPVEQFSFLLTAWLSSEGLEVGLTCHVKPFYESYKRLLTLFFEDPHEWKRHVDMLPTQPPFSGSVHLGRLVPHRLLATPSTIRFEANLVQVCHARFPADTSSVITWIGLAANSAIIHFDVTSCGLSPNETRLIRRFFEAIKSGTLLAFDELEVDESNPEVWTWA
jgi:hypothetical protein